eukprot:512940_1
MDLQRQKSWLDLGDGYYVGEINDLMDDDHNIKTFGDVIECKLWRGMNKNHKCWNHFEAIFEQVKDSRIKSNTQEEKNYIQAINQMQIKPPQNVTQYVNVATFKRKTKRLYGAPPPGITTRSGPPMNNADNNIAPATVPDTNIMGMQKNIKLQNKPAVTMHMSQYSAHDKVKKPQVTSTSSIQDTFSQDNVERLQVVNEVDQSNQIETDTAIHESDFDQEDDVNYIQSTNTTNKLRKTGAPQTYRKSANEDNQDIETNEKEKDQLNQIETDTEESDDGYVNNIQLINTSHTAKQSGKIGVTQTYSKSADNQDIETNEKEDNKNN